MNSISVVIPVYRAERTLRQLCHELHAELPTLSTSYEVIFVEDCGGDNSWQVIQELVNQDSRVRGIRLSRNFGQHNALLCGIRQARNDVVITMDDDMQHPVPEIKHLLAALDDRTDVVYGAPAQQQHGFMRNMASRLTKIALASAMGAETARNVSAFRVFRTCLRDGFRDYRSPSVSIDVLLAWSTARFKAVKVTHAPRAVGTSGYTASRLMSHAFNLMTGFSTVPLQIASIIGFAFVLVGIGVMAVVLINYMVRGSAVPGFAFLASIITIFSGAQLFALGVFGEYLARMHFRSMDRPAFVVREMTGSENGGVVATGQRRRPPAVDNS